MNGKSSCIVNSEVDRWVKMTLSSAACLWRALEGHLAGTCISSGTLQSPLRFSPITLVIHLFLCHSHILHLWLTWSARCPVNASLLTYQGLEASFYKALTSFLDVSKGFTFFVTSMSLGQPLSPFRVSMKTCIVHC